jgi:outer membrane protein assembly factor BamB
MSKLHGDTRLCRKTPSSARERAIFLPDKDGEAGDVGFIVDTAGCRQAEKGPLEARSGFPTEPTMAKWVLFALCLCWSMDAYAGDWMNWRGPFYNGSTDETNLPATWSQTENIAWTADLPGAAASTPVIAGDRIFLSGVDAARKVLLATCLDRKTGKRLWQYDIAEGLRRDRNSNYAASSPVTDGKIVVFFYANGDLKCFNVEGKEQWARNIHKDYGTFAFQWTFSSSPVLFQGKLYLQVLQRDVPVKDRGFSDRKNESYLLAMNPNTGKTLWRHIRPSKAVRESLEAFTTPIPVTFQGRQQLLIVGGDALSGHDLQTGQELWRWGTWNPERIGHWRLVPSPVIGQDVILACGPKNAPIFAIHPHGQGVQDNSAILWNTREVDEVKSDVPTPAFYDGDFFVLNDLGKHVSRVEARTGRVKWTMPTPGRDKYRASPLAADGKIYLINHAGDATVIDAAKGNILHQISMDEPKNREVVRASIVAVRGQLFIRTTRKLYCVGTGADAGS